MNYKALFKAIGCVLGLPGGIILIGFLTLKNPDAMFVTFGAIFLLYLIVIFYDNFDTD